MVRRSRLLNLDYLMNFIKLIIIFQLNKRQKKDFLSEFKIDVSRIPKPEIIHYDKILELYFNPGLIRESREVQEENDEEVDQEEEEEEEEEDLD